MEKTSTGRKNFPGWRSSRTISRQYFREVNQEKIEQVAWVSLRINGYMQNE